MSGILAGISSGTVAGILRSVLAGISSGILAGILRSVLAGISSGILAGILRSPRGDVLPDAPIDAMGRMRGEVSRGARAKRLRTVLGAACLVTCAAGAMAAGVARDSIYVSIPGGSFVSALKYEDSTEGVTLKPFQLMQRPVTNGEFLTFVLKHPSWRRDRVPAALAEERYLSHWSGPARLAGAEQAAQPVTWVSWFAARAYCEALGARLPDWLQWEYAAAADEQRRDARTDPRWRDLILSWYARPSNQPLPAVAQQAPNAYGAYDLHGLVWEWTEDYSALLVSADNRNQGDADRAKFCGSGALSTRDRDNYAVLMRVAMLSALQGRDATANLGFRCAR